MIQQLAVWRAPATIFMALTVQVLAAMFFVGDALMELNYNVDKGHPLTELPVALALAIGIFFAIRELRAVLGRAKAQASALGVASGAFYKVMDTRFVTWKLTPAERDVAQLSLKGLDVVDIAKLRAAAPGTIRAQFARVYAKSGVNNRAQFASLFLEDLMGAGPPAAGGTPTVN
jgi:DNA-binding CsgD family transcriptional regulator